MEIQAKQAVPTPKYAQTGAMKRGNASPKSSPKRMAAKKRPVGALRGRLFRRATLKILALAAQMRHKSLS